MRCSAFLRSDRISASLVAMILIRVCVFLIVAYLFNSSIRSISSAFESKTLSSVEAVRTLVLLYDVGGAWPWSNSEMALDEFSSFPRMHRSLDIGGKETPSPQV